MRAPTFAIWGTLVVALLLIAAPPAHAEWVTPWLPATGQGSENDSVTFIRPAGTDGDHRGASVTFSLIGGGNGGGNGNGNGNGNNGGSDQLRVTLSNENDFTRKNIDLLAGVFFNADDSFDGLVPVRAEVPDGSFITTDPVQDDTPIDVSEHWAYRSGIEGKGDLDGAPADYGIGAVGLGVFGPKYLFSEEEVGGQPNGPDYTLISEGTFADDDGYGNQPLDPNPPRVEHQTQFFFDLPDGFDSADLQTITMDEVIFQYGTEFTPTPTASSVGLAMMLLLGIHRLFSRGAHCRHRLLQAH